MSSEVSATSKDEQDSTCLANARELVRQLELGNSEEANLIINELSTRRDNDLYQEIGKLTRALHNNLNGPIDDSRMRIIMQEDLPDAKNRLDYVIKLTEQSAHNTLSSVEHGMPVVDRLRERAQDLEKQWQDFLSTPKDVSVFRSLATDNCDYLQSVVDEAKTIHTYFSDILLAQSYQDITGQVIQHVLNMVQEVEHGLVGIIQASSQVVGSSPQEDEKKNSHGHGPAIPGAQKKRDVLNGQDDVDDLLSTLGF